MDYWDGYIYILQATQAEAAICLRWLYGEVDLRICVY